MATGLHLRKVKVYYTGGTIGMAKNADGVYAPKANAFKDKIVITSQLHDTELAKHLKTSDRKFEFIIGTSVPEKAVVYLVEEFTPLLDSSDVAQNEWKRCADCVEDDYDAYDGFVILHGTDTMAYTASALSFMLEGLAKPVVVTGSMISIFDSRSDAIENMQTALIIAGCYKIPEVCVYFGRKLLRGNRTTKVSVRSYQAFDSLNYPPLAYIGCQVEVNESAVWDKHVKHFKVQNVSHDVIILTVFPGITPAFVKKMLSPPAKGVVLKCFGTGNIPSDPNILKAINEAVTSGIMIIKVTMNLNGSVTDDYEAGLPLTRAGVISGCDMTIEAAFTKLCVVLAKIDLPLADKYHLLRVSICGELNECAKP